MFDFDDCFVLSVFHDVSFSCALVSNLLNYVILSPHLVVRNSYFVPIRFDSIRSPCVSLTHARVRSDALKIVRTDTITKTTLRMMNSNRSLVSTTCKAMQLHRHLHCYHRQVRRRRAHSMVMHCHRRRLLLLLLRRRRLHRQR